jgi:hypothetical protein
VASNHTADREKDADTVLKNDMVRIRQLSIDDGTGTGRRRSSSVNHSTAATSHGTPASDRSTTSNVIDHESSRRSGSQPKDNTTMRQAFNTDGSLFHAKSSHPSSLRG